MLHTGPVDTAIIVLFRLALHNSMQPDRRAVIDERDVKYFGRQAVAYHPDIVDFRTRRHDDLELGPTKFRFPVLYLYSKRLRVIVLSQYRLPFQDKSSNMTKINNQGVARRLQ